MPNSDWAEASPQKAYQGEVGMQSGGRSPAVFDMMQDQYDELCKLRELVDMLEGKIAPVMGPPLPEATSPTDMDSPSRSDVAAKLDDHNDMLKMVNRRLSSFYKRIEL